ncbi:MAG: hypothetical protein Q8N63_02105, partial [Nanoarchaeota archaeon]|nr:hypothetical protein [Nanoarchaeota archaeon]
MILKYPIIDMHTHLRNDIYKHTKYAKENGIDTVIYMANSNPPLDNLEIIKSSLNEPRYCKAYPVSAITKNLEGKKLVDVEKIKNYVVGFSDDGNYLKDLKILEDILSMDVLVLAHCSPSYEIGVEAPDMETRYIEKYLPVLGKTKGRLHVQHLSKKGSIELVKAVKKQGMNITCEACPHHFTYSRDELDIKVNPPLATRKDVIAIQEGL